MAEPSSAQCEPSVVATSAPELRRARYRWGPLWAGLALVLSGVVLVLYAAGQSGALGFMLPDWAVLLTGIGLPVELVLGLVRLALDGKTDLALTSGLPHFYAGLGAWTVGWSVIALFGLRRAGGAREPPSEAVGAPLYPRLARYRDFYWSTLGAYGGGFLMAEVALILVHTALASRTSATTAFLFAGLVASAIAFVAGFLGAARARRLAVPEATIGFLYFGIPIPLLLTLVTQDPQLQMSYGPLLKEVIYLSSLLGRPEVGFWLVFAGLGLVMVLGITSGFVATSSGRVDLRAGVEVFIAGRHVEVFHPMLLLGIFLVLVGGILPPLLIYAMVRAANQAVDKTRIRKLGQEDPLKATAALHETRLKEQTPTAMMTALSVGGTGVGVMALIIVLSVMSGFELDLQQKILGTNAHALVLKYGDTFTSSPDEVEKVMEKVGKVRGVKGQTPFILNEVMISSDGNISGSMIKGIDPATVGSVTDLPKNILKGGSIENLVHPERILSTRLAPGGGGLFDDRAAVEEAPPPPEPEQTEDQDALDELVLGPSEPSGEGSEAEPVLPGIIIGRELASSMRVVVGDRLNVVSPLGGELGPQGPMPKMRPFRVGGIFYSGMYEYDSKFVYIRLDEAQKFFNMEGVTGIELKVDDIDNARRISKQVYDTLEGYPYRTKDWGEMNKNLFAALRLEKLVMGIILSIIIIVATGLIVATVMMLVLEKRKEIAVLKALGVPDGGIVKIFLAEGLQIGVAGGLLGLVSGLVWCFFIERVGIKLDPEVYYIPALPVRIEPFQTGLAVVIAVLVTYLASIYPALKASQVDPVEGLKAE